jgi:hypothetical protein
MQMHYTDPQRNYPIRMWGSKLVENISQALSRIIVTDIAIRMLKTGYRPFLTTHDSLDYCVPEGDASAVDAELARQFAHVPAWAHGLPLASEGGWGKNLHLEFLTTISLGDMPKKALALRHSERCH